MTPKPQPMKVLAENIPVELKQQSQWVLWNWVWNEKKGKWDKPLFQLNGFHASSSDFLTWSTFEDAWNAYERGRSDGIGFVISENDPFVGIDLDGVRNKETGESQPWADDLIKRFSSYTEISPSGTGFKTLIKGKLPGTGHHGEEIGIFDQGRYFCLTGHTLNGFGTIKEAQDAITRLIKERWPGDFRENKIKAPSSNGNALSFDAIIQKAIAHDHNGKFKNLWGGDWTGYKSQSEADLALLGKLRFWTDGDREKMDALFRQSGLYRKKWEYASYREASLDEALKEPVGRIEDEDAGPQEDPAMELERKTNGKVSIDHVYDAGRMIQEYQTYIQNLEKINFLTGVKQIDQKIRGVAAGEVITIIARAGSFKTAALQNLLKNYIQHSSWGATFFSLEMPIASVTERYHEIISGYRGDEVERVYRDKEAHLGIIQKNFIAELERLYIVPVKVNLKQIAQYVELIEAHYGVRIGVIGIDYLGLLDARGQNEYEIVSRLAREVKTMAKELSLPVILLTQTSRRAGSGETEVTADMARGSGAIEEACDFMLGLFQVEKKSENGEPEYDLICKILKNRKGPRNSMWKLDLNPRTLYLESEAEPWKPAKKNNKGIDL